MTISEQMALAALFYFDEILTKSLRTLVKAHLIRGRSTVCNFTKKQTPSQIFSRTLLKLGKTPTVKPLYSGHLRDRPIVSAVDRCPLYRGLTKSMLKSQQNPISRTHSSLSIVILGGGGLKWYFIDNNIIVLTFLYLNLISILVNKEDREPILQSIITSENLPIITDPDLER